MNSAGDLETKLYVQFQSHAHQKSSCKLSALLISHTLPMSTGSSFQLDKPTHLCIQLTSSMMAREMANSTVPMTVAPMKSYCSKH